VPKLIGIRGAIRVERNDADLITYEWGCLGYKFARISVLKSDGKHRIGFDSRRSGDRVDRGSTRFANCVAGIDHN